MNFFRRLLPMLCSLMAVGLFWNGNAARSDALDPPPLAWDTYSDTWVGMDGLGRPLPTYEDVGPPQTNKKVGIFYFLWVDGRTGVVNDNNLVLSRDPNYVFPLAPGSWNWWAEPLFGYYLITDPFVLRKHAQMLQDAGVDTLAFDSTNSYLHESQYNALCQVYEDIRSHGQGTPQFFHVTNAQSGKTVQKIYDEFYSQKSYPDLWFRWLGKPLILAHPDEMTDSLKDYFTVRYCWAYNAGKWFGDGQDKWPWIDTYPQKYGWHDAPNVPEEMSVALAHHATSNRGRSLAGQMLDGKWHEQQPPPADQHPAQGIQFSLQGQQALKTDPSFVFLTGWNEWIAPAGGGAGRKFLGHVLTKDQEFFVDEYSPEYSRDAEPMSADAPNSFGDNYYYQMVDFIRHYKGVRPLSYVRPAAITFNGTFTAWQKVQPEFRDDIGDPVHRDFDGFAKGTHYTNQTGRNDIVAAKVSCDKTNLYFYVRTNDKLTPHTDKDWMLLYLNVGANYKSGWLGYNFIVNRQPGETTTSLEKNVGGGYQWASVGRVKYQASGRELVIAIPRALLGAKVLPPCIDFKWADNCYARGDWTDFTLNGDAAPNDRFNYRAKFQTP